MSDTISKTQRIEGRAIKRQKKYLTPADVEKDIAKAHKKIHKLKLAAQTHLDLESLAEGVDVAARRKHSEEADRLLKQIERLKNTRLKKLGYTLAQMQTIPLGAAAGVSGLNESQVTLRAVN